MCAELSCDGERRRKSCTAQVNVHTPPLAPRNHPQLGDIIATRLRGQTVYAAATGTSTSPLSAPRNVQVSIEASEASEASEALSVEQTPREKVSGLKSN